MSNQENTLGIVPDDWNVLALGDLGSWGGGSTPRKSNHEYWGGSMPWVSPKDMGESVVQRTEDHVTEEALSQTNLSVYRPGSVVVVFRSGVLRHTFPVATLDQPFTVNQDMKVLTTREEVDDRFVFHLLRCMGPLVLQRATKVGTTVESVDTTSFKSLPVGVPAFREQRRIADVLDTVDAAIRETDDVIAKQERVKTGLLQDLLTRGLDADGRLRDPETEPGAFRETALGLLPRKWKMDSLESFAASGSKSLGNGPFGCNLLTSEMTHEGIPVIYIADIEEGRYNRATNRHVTREKARELSAFEVRNGDVMLTKVGDPPCDAAPYLEGEKAIMTQDVIRIRPAPDVDTWFLTDLFNSSLGRRAVESIAVEGTRKRVSLTDLRTIRLPRPPYREQIRIGEVIGLQREKMEKEKQYRGKLETLKTGLMQDLLTGRVRVPEAEGRIQEITR